MSFYDNLCRYEDSNVILSALHQVTLRKTECRKNKFVKNNKIKGLARRPDELCRRTFSYSSLREEDGYLTIESALVIPVFLFVIISILYVFIMLGTDVEIYRAMKDTSTDIEYIEALLSPSNDAAGRDLAIKVGITKNLGSNFFKENIIKGGLEGIDVSDSTYDKSEGVLDIVAEYKYQVPYIAPTIGLLKRKQRFKCRLYTGINLCNSEEHEEKYVYVTKSGSVYHLDRDCSYLKLNISNVFYDDIDDLRNKWGEKYYPCDRCVDNKNIPGIVYVTEDGNRYHSSLECFCISRDVTIKKLSEVGGLRACSRCGK